MKNEAVSSYSWDIWRLIFLLLLTPSFAFVGGLLAAPFLAGLRPGAPTLTEEMVVMAYGEALAQIYEKVVPSVVRLEVTGSREPPVEAGAGTLTTPISPRPISPSKGQGSGFVWDKRGHIVTNFHVVQGAEHIEIIFANGTQVEARVIGTDLNTDLALLKIDLPPAQLFPVTLGDSDKLKVGQLILAIGAPFGQEFTMTSGIIGAVGRTMKSCDSCYPIAEAIQTDASLNPGNSGGPLLNERGEVIGINTWIISRSGGNAGIGFALSSKAMKQVVPTLISTR